MRKKVRKAVLRCLDTFQVVTSGYHNLQISIIHHYKLQPNTTGQNAVQIGFLR